MNKIFKAVWFALMVAGVGCWLYAAIERDINYVTLGAMLMVIGNLLSVLKDLIAIANLLK